MENIKFSITFTNPILIPTILSLAIFLVCSFQTTKASYMMLIKKKLELAASLVQIVIHPVYNHLDYSK